MCVYVNESASSIKPYTCAIWPCNSLPCPPEWDGYVWLHHTHTCTHAQKTQACPYQRRCVFLMIIEIGLLAPMQRTFRGSKSNYIQWIMCQDIMKHLKIYIYCDLLWIHLQSWRYNHIFVVSKGNSTNFTHLNLFTGLGEYLCICKKRSITPFVAPEEAAVETLI